MARDLTIVAFWALLTYAWMCAVVAPIARTAKIMAVTPTAEAWTAGFLALAGCVLWTMVVLSGLSLLLMLAPTAGLVLLGSPLRLFGVAAGAVSWITYAVAAGRLPRVGRTFETATALSIVEFVCDRPDILTRVEQLYQTHAAPAARSIQSSLTGADALSLNS